MASGFPQSGLPGGEYAGIGARLGAVIIDGLIASAGALPGFIIVIIGFVLAANMNRSEQGIAFVVLAFGYVVCFLGALIVFLYNVSKLGKTGQTIGKKFMKIKVVTLTGEPLGFGKAFLREFLRGLIANLCIILAFWPAWDKEKQGLHDKAVGTHVYPA